MGWVCFVRLSDCVASGIRPSAISCGQENIKTLREALVQRQTALGAGDYATAFKVFEEIQITFSQELEVLERVFQKDKTRDYKRIQCYRIVTISSSTILRFHYF